MKKALSVPKGEHRRHLARPSRLHTVAVVIGILLLIALGVAIVMFGWVLTAFACWDGHGQGACDESGVWMGGGFVAGGLSTIATAVWLAVRFRKGYQQATRQRRH